MTTSVGRRGLIGIVVTLVVLVALVVPVPFGLAASCPIEFWDCWNPNNHPNCTGTTSTVKTQSTPIGTLELRYRGSPCRHAWGRIVTSSSFTNLWAYRQTSPIGDTNGLSWYTSGTSNWSKMLNDDGHLTYAVLRYNGVNYYTDAY